MRASLLGRGAGRMWHLTGLGPPSLSDGRVTADVPIVGFEL